MICITLITLIGGNMITLPLGQWPRAKGNCLYLIIIQEFFGGKSFASAFSGIFTEQI
eukprot:UN11883